MTSDVPCVPPGMTLEAVVDEVILPRGLVEVPVVDQGLLIGMLSFQSFRGKGPAALERLTASDVMTRDFLEQTISPDEDAFKVLARLGSDDHRLAVVSGGVLAGIVSREDALRRLSLILELRGERQNP
jgi:CBS domain-containing protein